MVRQGGAGSAAFHLQQAAEKLLKGLLVTVSVPFGKTRDLERLAALAAPHYPDMASFLGGIASLMPWAVVYRYPGFDDEPVPTPEELECVSVVIEAHLRKVCSPDWRGV